MQDPHPENIEGVKRHSFAWNIDVDLGHVALALALLVAVWFGYRLLGENTQDVDGRHPEVME